MCGRILLHYNVSRKLLKENMEIQFPNVQLQKNIKRLVCRFIFN